jgi:hypothetical protein
VPLKVDPVAAGAAAAIKPTAEALMPQVITIVVQHPVGHHMRGPGFASGKERKSTDVPATPRLHGDRKDRDLGSFSIRLLGWHDFSPVTVVS